ncbi:hypothetical protein B0I35DRAFT_450812 [Stachybotrys elegans]|uniref:JmjC domain-containing protein n=1 Tax=Stachybotrys elegans TaxID=80388 RepID=A0A8K0WSV9_9HYPO|nr:hypothetical protein B0I35DRAFT_450812 [Stachybotrys elegans]
MFRACTRFGAPSLSRQLLPASRTCRTLTTLHQCLAPERPFLFKKEAGSPTSHLPALKKWFDRPPLSSSGVRLSPNLEEFQDWPFPYELWTPPSEQGRPIAAFRDWLMASQDMMDGMLAGILQSVLEEAQHRAFFQLHAPLRLLAQAIEFNAQAVAVGSQPVQVYIAQSSISDLPEPLQNDLPAPEFVRRAGKGDVYNSSVWLGTEPTYTPLHRDPNPNLFSQLCNSKIVRLLPPALGERLFFEVQSQIRQQASSRIRTTEMMEGKEREVLRHAVWDPEVQLNELYEAELADGDALFIPKGWWHSVKSKTSDGKLNASVNWWFR